ncbi:hypothetical protein BDV12DRAFT_176988 [Aspergillus spectabilis]
MASSRKTVTVVPMPHIEAIKETDCWGWYQEVLVKARILRSLGTDMFIPPHGVPIAGRPRLLPSAHRKADTSTTANVTTNPGLSDSGLDPETPMALLCTHISPNE